MFCSNLNTGRDILFTTAPPLQIKVDRQPKNKPACNIVNVSDINWPFKKNLNRYFEKSIQLHTTNRPSCSNANVLVWLIFFRLIQHCSTFGDRIALTNYTRAPKLWWHIVLRGPCYSLYKLWHSFIPTHLKVKHPFNIRVVNFQPTRCYHFIFDGSDLLFICLVLFRWICSR